MSLVNIEIQAIQHLLKTQQWLAAVLRAEQTVAQLSSEVAAHHCLAQTLQTAFDHHDAATICRDTLRQLPDAFTTRLAFGLCFESQGDYAQACLHYVRANQQAQQQGFWFDDATTPPWLRARVKSAMQLVLRYRLQLFEQLIAPLDQQFGCDELQRVRKCIAIYLGLQPKIVADSRQHPSFLYFPDLPTQAIFERSLFPWAEWFEAQTERLRDEMFAILASREVEAFHRYESAAEAEHLFKGASWDAYFFYRHGTAYPSHLNACPHTANVLQQLPQVMIREHAPETCFSILRPGTHILPHRGVTNVRSVLHLPLVLPGQCALNIIDAHCYEWKLGECFAFDDTFEHEAWNRSEQTRVILLTDIWNPHLREAERLAMQKIIESMGDFNQAVATT